MAAKISRWRWRRKRHRSEKKMASAEDRRKQLGEKGDGGEKRNRVSAKKAHGGNESIGGENKMKRKRKAWRMAAINAWHNHARQQWQRRKRAMACEENGA